jgi:DNA polymerase III epsilon subunit-like protein
VHIDSHEQMVCYRYRNNRIETVCNPLTNREDEIIELAAVSISDDKIGSAFQTYVQTKVTNSAESINQISEE